MKGENLCPDSLIQREVGRVVLLLWGHSGNAQVSRSDASPLDTTQYALAAGDSMPPAVPAKRLGASGILRSPAVVSNNKYR